MNGNSIARIDQTLPPQGLPDSGIEIINTFSGKLKSFQPIINQYWK